MALENLQRHEFTAYCPVLRRRRSHARRVTSVLRPLFPGYLFVCTGTNFGRWRPILSIYGVHSIVCNGQNISCIDHAFIAGLQKREVDGVIVHPLAPYQKSTALSMALSPP